jgi:uncharacterized protein YlbG (UPF0298 family)
LKKIEKSEVKSFPFKHIYIENFLSKKHFEELINLDELNTSGDDIKSLIASLNSHGWVVHSHPGTFSTLKKYLKYRNSNKFNSKYITGTRDKPLVDSGGIAFRLKKQKQTQGILDLFQSIEFSKIVSEKFKINLENTKIDVGIQKYLDGYEISPHPDTLEKALTWMLNLNTSKNSNNDNYHTRYLIFKKKYDYIYQIWKNFKTIQRYWVPWHWCESKFIQSKNNSIVIFSPYYKSLHAIKCSYKDLKNQRTQLYGNIWFKQKKAKYNYLTYENYDLEQVAKKIEGNLFKNSIYRLKSFLSSKGF